MRLFSNARYFVRAAFSGIRRSFFLQMVAAFTLGVMLFSWGLVRCAGRGLDAVWQSVQSQVEFTVYVSPTLDEAGRRSLQSQLEQTRLGQVTFVSPEEALARLQAELGEVGEGLKGLQENPLSPSFELRLKKVTYPLDTLQGHAEALRTLPGVLDVDYRQDAVERVWTLAEGFGKVGLWALALVALVAVFIIAATLQLAMLSRRDEIEIQQWVGATRGFVRGPFLLEGLWQGALGASGAVLALAALERLGAAWFSRGFSFLKVDAPVVLLDSALGLELFLSGGLLGLLGSLIAVGRFLRV
jgi:cell division transport system permease protein